MTAEDRKAVNDTARLVDLRPRHYELFWTLCERLYASGESAGLDKVVQVLGIGEDVEKHE